MQDKNVKRVVNPVAHASLHRDPATTVLPEIPGLKVHLSTVYGGVTASQRYVEINGAIERLNGLSGTTISPTQPIENRRLLLEVPQDYHLIGAKFNGIDSYLANIGSLINSQTTMTVFIVYRQPVVETGSTQLLSLFATGQTDWNDVTGFSFFPTDVSAASMIGYRQGEKGKAPAMPINETYVYAVNFNGSTISEYVNGKVYGFNNFVFSAGSFSINNLIIGGDYQENSNFIPEGYFFELIISDQSLNVSKMDEVHAYLKSVFLEPPVDFVTYNGIGPGDIVTYRDELVDWR